MPGAVYQCWGVCEAVQWLLRAAWGVKSCALSVCCAVPNQDVSIMLWKL